MKRLVISLLLLVGCDGDLRFTRPDAAVVTDTTRQAADGATVIECTSDDNCTRELLRRCDLAAHVCVECGTAADCGGDEICEPKTKRCMHKCGEASSCASETPFCDARGLCVCTATSCAASDREICDPTGRCVECVNDSQCPADEPRCDLRVGECVR